MKKSIFFTLVLGLLITSIKAQYYEIRPSFISLTGGAGNVSLKDCQFPGYYGKVEGAFFINYLFGVGLQVNHGYYKPFENRFADNRVNTPRFNYNKTTATLDNYIVQNYTVNAYFNAMPNWWFSFMGCGGVGIQRTLTPQGSILYEEIYPYQNYGEAYQSATIDINRETRTAFVFHAGMRVNLMVSDRFGFTFNTDYFYSKHNKYGYNSIIPEEVQKPQIHEFTGTAGIIILLNEMLY